MLTSVVAGAAVTASGGLSAVPAAAATPTRFSLAADGVHRIDPPPRTRPGATDASAAAAGERSVVGGTIRTSRGDTGTFHADVVRLHDRGQRPHGGVASTLEQHVFTLPGGTIVGTGTADLAGRGTFAIVGGSGAYAGCHGSYTSEQRRTDLGGDGTARFEFSIDSRGVNR